MSVGLTRAELAGIGAAVDHAMGLPNRAYVDPAFLALERETLFANTWVCVGTGASIPDPGGSDTRRV